MSYLVVAFALAFVWNFIATQLEMNEPLPTIILGGGGIGLAYLIDPETCWYLGVGVAGMAWIIYLLSGVLLVAGDVLLAKLVPKR